MSRPFSTVTPLGQLMRKHGLAAHEVCAYTGIHQRILTYYLSRQRPISATHLATLMEFFELDSSEELTDYEVVPYQPDGSSAARLFFEMTTDDVDIEGLLSHGTAKPES